MVNAYPAGVHLGASWNRELVGKVGGYMGGEFKRKGVNVALAPVVGPIGRIAKGGRNWEGYGADPYLSGALASKMVGGLQESVGACVKHLVGNEQETNRMPDLLGVTSSVSANIGERAMMEVYAWGFQDVVTEGVVCVMCSYNRVNGTYACENDKLLNGLLKKEMGFRGFVVSDWMAQHSGVKSAKNGLDMVMPDAAYWKDNALAKAVNSSSMTQARLDDMATRILASYYKLGMDSPTYPPLGIGLPASITKPHTLIDARDPKARSTIFQAAVEGHVLVKNKNNTLPLRNPQLLSLFGFDTYAPLLNNPSSSPLSRWTLGANSLAISDLAYGASIATGLGVPQIAEAGTLIGGSGSGAATGSYISAPYNAFENKAYEDGTALLWDFKSEDPDVHPGSTACIIFLNEFAMEGADRPGLADAKADRLVLNVARKCTNTIVVIHNAGIRLVEAWIEHVNVTAVILGHLPGQDSGRALVEVMYGKQSPSGRLSYTVARKEGDYGALLEPYVPGFFDRTSPSSKLSSALGVSGGLLMCTGDFSEGLYIDYRDFMKRNIQPRFPFGYGLTYSTFGYSNLEATWKDTKASNATLSPLAPESPISEGGQESLFQILATVTCTISNTGTYEAAEVSQLYIGIANAPARQLRGFEKVLLEPGQTANVSFALMRRDLSIWSVERQAWILQRGSYNIMVGANVLDIKLDGHLQL